MGESTDFDPWAPSTGLVDSYKGKIVSARFGFDAEYNNGQTCLLLLEVKTDAEELAEKDFIDTLKLSTGSGWEPKEKGAKVVREDGKAKGFNNRSAVWTFVVAAVEAGAGDAMKANGTPFEAATFEGLEFDFERVTYKDQGGADRSRMLPVKFVGAGGGGGSKAKAEVEVEAEEIPGAVKVALIKLAKECEDHDTFIERAFTEVDGVSGSKAAEAAVMDANGIFATANA